MKSTIFVKVLILGLMSLSTVVSTQATLASSIVGVSRSNENRSIAVAAQPSPQELIDEAWQIVNKYFIDGRINQADWLEARKYYLSKKCDSMADAYISIRQMLRVLNDPFTRFLDPTEFKKIQVVNVKQPNINSSDVNYDIRSTTSGKIGYIRIRQFGAKATNEMQNTISTLERSSVAGYILDLRSNQGGLLYSAIDIARMWLNDGLIVTMNTRGKTPQTLAANKTAITLKPLVVLVDSGSAGTELLIGALQDNQRAKIVGTPTYGRNTIQSVRPLSGGSGIAVTVARWLTPKRGDIGNIGIKPDTIVRLTKEQVQVMTNQRNLVGTLADPQYKQAMDELLQSIK
jgi:C-terminal processing protease CtpA/Prc